MTAVKKSIKTHTHTQMHATHTNNHTLVHASIDDDDDDNIYSYLFQRLSVIVQRFNSVLIHESFVSELHKD